MTISAKVIIAALGLATLAGCASADPNSPAGKRHAAYEAIGDANRALGGIFEEATPDLAAAATSMAAMKAQVTIVPTLFPAGSGPESGQPTEALPAIWEKPAEFSAAMTALTDGVATLDAAITSGDAAAAKAAHSALGKTCKGCHSKFRKD